MRQNHEQFDSPVSSAHIYKWCLSEDDKSLRRYFVQQDPSAGKRTW